MLIYQRVLDYLILNIDEWLYIYIEYDWSWDYIVTEKFGGWDPNGVRKTPLKIWENMGN